MVDAKLDSMKPKESGDLDGAVAADLRAVEAIGTALRGTNKPFIGTNATGGIALAGFSGVLTESVALPGGPRIDTENRVIAFSNEGVCASVVRLPPAVHSRGRYGFVSGLIDVARATGVSGYLGDGANRRTASDARDVAQVYRLALESAPAGSRWHAVAEENISFRSIAAAIADQLGIPAKQVPQDRPTSSSGSCALSPQWTIPSQARSRAQRWIGIRLRPDSSR